MSSSEAAAGASPFVAGGNVQAGDGVYIDRAADQQLLQCCREGYLAYVLTSRQMGKSSLMIRTAGALLDESIRSVIIDLTELGADVTADQWYKGILLTIADQLELSVNTSEWWNGHSELSRAHRFDLFLREVVLREIASRVVIFIDEIDTTIRLDFTDDFFAAIRFLHQGRATDKDLARLSFVLIGVATPGDLVKDAARTPFNVGQAVDLTDFTRAEAKALAERLESGDGSRGVLDEVLRWTGGHPYLTLRVFRTLWEEAHDGGLPGSTSGIVTGLFFGEQSKKDSNLNFVREMLTSKAPERAEVLAIYRDVLRGKRVADESQHVCKNWLKLSGVVREEDGILEVRNPIYERVFDLGWVKQHLPVDWPKRLAKVGRNLLFVFMALLAPLAVFATYQWRVAVREGREANSQRAAADSQRAAAVAAAEEANANLLRAEQAESVAKRDSEAARMYADSASRSAALEREQRLENERLAPLVEAKSITNVAVLMQSMSPNQTEVAKLLLMEALDLNHTWEAEQALRADLHLLRREVSSATLDDVATAAALSPDGQTGVVVGRDGSLATALLWGHGEPTVFADYFGRPTRVAIGSSRAAVLVGDYRGTIAAIRGGGRFAPVARVNGSGEWLGITPDGTWYAARGRDDQIHIGEAGEEWSIQGSFPGKVAALGAPAWLATENTIYDLRDGARADRRFALPARGDIEHVAFSPDGSRLCQITVDGTILVLDISPDRGPNPGSLREYSLPVSGRSVVALAFSADGAWLAICLKDGPLRILSTAGRITEHSTLLQDEAANTVSFSPSGDLLVTGNQDGSVRVWELRTGTETARLWHADAVWDARFTNGESLVVSASRDGTIRVWDLESNGGAVALPYAGEATFHAFTSDGEYVAAASEQSVRVWDTSNGKLAADLPNDGRECIGIQFTPDDERLVTACSEEGLTVWDWRRDRVTMLPEYEEPMWVAISPDGRLVAGSGSTDKTARVWRLADDKEVARLPHPGQTGFMTFAGNDKIATICEDNSARVWDIQTGKELLTTTLGDDVVFVKSSQDGRYVVVSGDDGTARLIDVETMAVAHVLEHGEEVIGLDFHPDGRRLATASVDTFARIWDIETGRELSRFEHSAGAIWVAFSPNGRHLFTTSEDGTAHVWEVASGDEIARIGVGGDETLGGFTADGDRLVITGPKPQITYWPLARLRQSICGLLSRNLSPDEWRRYVSDTDPPRETCPGLPLTAAPGKAERRGPAAPR